MKVLWKKNVGNYQLDSLKHFDGKGPMQTFYDLLLLHTVNPKIKIDIFQN